MVKGKIRRLVRLSGVIVRIGNKFCFPSLDCLEEREKRISMEMIKKVGSGPFVLLKVEYFPRDGHPLFMLHFKNDNGKDVEITSEYFVKYIEREEKKFKLCKPDCEDCKKDENKYNKLMGDLCSMHLASSNDPVDLCLPDFKYFDRNHPKFLDLSRMQGRLFEIAYRQHLSWTRS